MAYITTSAPVGPGATNLLARFGTWLVSLGENHPAIRQIEIYQAMTDEELAKIGLKRFDIARKVFSGRGYL